MWIELLPMSMAATFMRRVAPGEFAVRLTLGKRKLERKITVIELPPDRLGRIR